jgi:hypothetical protein
VLTSTPTTDGRGRTLAIGLGIAALVLGGAAWLFIATGGDTAAPGGPEPDVTTDDTAPPEDNDVTAAAERPTPPKSPKTAARPSASPGATAPAAAPPPAAAPAARELRVTSDVDGAMVFLNRKYLGTTPLVSRDVTPGTYQLNVQVEGVEPEVRTIEIADDGPTSVNVPLKQVQLDARVPVDHRHGVGSCNGTLIASNAGLRYQTSQADHAFTLPFAQLETFEVNYLEKNLRVKQRGGRTWNFTTRDDNADPLLVFHRQVEQAR